MRALVVGCGRVGSAVALNLKSAGWEVSVIDEREDALGRLGDHWTGEFHVGHGMDISLLRQAPCEVLIVAFPQNVLDEEAAVL